MRPSRIAVGCNKGRLATLTS
ncbi:hypothetical protein A2U01_0095427, partial [Trifolium medium]|nr:hypothetical protein [Trifolium medium]